MSNTNPTNTINLGPRARRIVRLAARFVNPLVLLFAGRRWMQVVGILYHRGRRSGREYGTPIGMRRLGDGFVIPRTFSDNAAWYQNVKAAGEARIRYLGREYVVVEPEVIDYATAKPAFPRYERLQFRLIGINEYLRLRVASDTAIEPRSPGRTLNLALVVIALAQLMVVLDVAIVNVALPSIQRELHFAATDLEWVVNAYAIAFGGLLLLGGRTGDLFGRRRMFVIGAVLFTAGSPAGGLATSSAYLVAAQAAQGLGLPGAVLVTGGVSLLVYSLARVATHDWSDAVTRATLGVAIALLVAFVALESRGRDPLMPLRIFANRNRSGAFGLSLAIGAALSGMLFLLTLFLQNVLHFSPLQAGFAFLPTAAGVVVGAGLTSRLIGRVGPRVAMTSGALLVAIGMFLLSAVPVNAAHFTKFFGPLVVLLFGLGMAFVSTSVTAISGVRPNESGLASALLNVGRQLGGSLGIAIMGTVATTAGFGSAFEIAGAMGIAGFVIVLFAVRQGRSPEAAARSAEDEVAA